MNQQMQPAQQYSAERGDELSLIELWKVLVEYKLLIIVFTTLTTLGAIYYVLTLPTIYKVEVIMLPASGEVVTRASGRLGGLADIVGISLGSSNAGVQGEQALARLKTRSFLTEYIKKKNLKPVLYAEQWDEAGKKWIDIEPTDRDASELLLDMITVNTDPKKQSSIVTFILEWKNPKDPNKLSHIANSLVDNINSKEKQLSILEAKKSISFLEKEIERTSVLKSQIVIYSMIEQQMQKVMLANVRDEFVFKLIDPAVVPKRAETKPIFIIIFIGVVLGIFISSFLAVNINYFRRHSEKIK